MTAITQAVSAALLHFVWQGFAVGLLLWIALFLMRKGAAQARYAASCAALLVLALLPLITACVSYAPETALTLVKPVAASLLAARAWRASSGPAAAWLAGVQSWALPLWSFGVLAFSLRLVLGSRQVAMLRRQGTPADNAIVQMVAGLGRRLGLTRPVRVLISALADGPTVVGWIRPVILLPSATILGLTPEQLEAVLAHEIAHIRRYDYLVNMLQIVVETLMFYHPAVWWASGRIRHERELCCDDLAVRSCGDALCYARALTTIEKLRTPAPEMAMASTGGSLYYRIRRLMGEGTSEYGPSKLSGALTLVLGLACFLVNAPWMRGQAEVQQTPETTAIVEPQVRDASGVEVELGDAAVLHREPVIYPKSAAEKRIEGTVVVEVTLDARGEVVDARVLSGPEELRKAALESVLSWHFIPDAARTTRQVPIVFRTPSEEERAQSIEAAEAEQKVAESGAYELLQEQAAKVKKEIAEREALMEHTREMLAKLQQSLPTEQVEAQRAEYEALMNKMRAELAELQQRLSTEQMQGAQRELQTRALDAERALAEAKEGLETARRLTESPAGRRLSIIHVLGLPDEARKELVSRLAVQLGDALTHQSIEKIKSAVEAFDQHLVTIFMLLDDNRSVELLITTPDAGDQRVWLE